MLASHVTRFAGVLVVVVAITGCDIIDIGSGIPQGGRRWVVTVENLSPRPAQLFVAEDEGAMGSVVGTANPDVVPPGATVDVTFGVPPMGLWAIFVNPGPNGGPLVTQTDVPRSATGRMPFKIVISANGSPVSEVPDLPGWFGN